MFRGILLNTPEVLIESDTTKPGRIEYQYTVAGGITILFIEVKPKMGTRPERLDYYAQVIAESIGVLEVHFARLRIRINVIEACSYSNSQDGFDLPILSILCDGIHFRFLKYEADKDHPTFSLGQFQNGVQTVRIFQPEFDDTTNPSKGVLQIRSACDALYSYFLEAYRVGLTGYWNRSVRRSTAEGNSRDSTPKWYSAIQLAENAIEQARAARGLYDSGNMQGSLEVAQKALKLLHDR